MITIDQQLKVILRGRVCVLGIGNRLKGDDGAGSWLIDRLVDRTSAVVLDGGVAPENYLEKVVKAAPDTVLLVDAADFGGAPGEMRVLDPNELRGGGLSTHALSLDMAFQYLTSRCSASIFLLAIQPAALGLAERMSDPVARSVELLARHLPDILPRG